jgi:hypothetical protein
MARYLSSREKVTMHDEDKGLAHDLERSAPPSPTGPSVDLGGTIVALPACSDDKDDSAGGTVGDDSSTGDDTRRLRRFGPDG